MSAPLDTIEQEDEKDLLSGTDTASSTRPGGEHPVDTVPPTPAFASETDALHMLDSVLGYLAAADPTQVPTQVQARCLTVLERAGPRLTAARACYLSAFTA